MRRWNQTAASGYFSERKKVNCSSERGKKGWLLVGKVSEVECKRGEMGAEWKKEEGTGFWVPREKRKEGKFITHDFSISRSVGGKISLLLTELMDRKMLRCIASIFERAKKAFSRLHSPRFFGDESWSNSGDSCCGVVLPVPCFPSPGKCFEIKPQICRVH